MLFVALHAVILDPMPVYLDDTGFLELYRKFSWDAFSVFSYNFDTYKFYRVLGFDLNYLYYRFFVEHFDFAILLISVLYFVVLDGYIRTFGRIYTEETGDQKDRSDFQLLCLILMLSFPFSYYLIIFRYSFIGLASYLFNLLAIRYVYECTFRRSGLFPAFLVAVTYVVSLYLYEATLLMPLYYAAASFHLVAANRKYNRNRALACLALVSLCLMAYLLSQVWFIQNQPKLMKGAEIVANGSAVLGLEEQLIRKAMSLIYSFKWAFYYFGVNFRSYGPLQLATILAIPVACTAILWRVLSRLKASVARNTAQQMVDGAIFFGCTFGLWSYYWIFGSRFTTPPLYALFLPALGLSLLAVGLLLRHGMEATRNVLLRGGMCGVILFFFTANLISFLSARMSIEQSLREARTVAARVGEILKSGEGRYDSLVITRRSRRDAYARYIAHFDSHLKYYLSRAASGHPVRIVVDGRVLCNGRSAAEGTGEELVVRLEYDPVHNGLVRQKGDSNFRTPDKSGSDPCQVSMLDYVLYYDATAGGIVFRRVPKQFPEANG
ncbi:MAG: hypothetical protein ACD_55C00139G0005 [uncultured bacterium]|nr:MAG: hypothetical protein ACD_55C00139G0005 [uncultured bacterium]